MSAGIPVGCAAPVRRTGRCAARRADAAGAFASAARTRHSPLVTGFTLLELLVALAIFALLAVMAYGGLASVLNTRAASDVHADELRALEFTFRNLQRDIEQWVPRDVRDPYGDSRPALRGGPAYGVLLELTRGGWRNPAGLQRSTLQRVSYRLQDGALIRDQWLVLDPAQDSAVLAQPLLEEGVESVFIKFYDGQGQWHDAWPPLNVQNPGTPRLAEVTIETERWGRLRWLFRFPA